MRDLAAEGLIQAVLIYAPDRLSRRYAHQILLIEELARAGVETLFVRAPRGSTPEDELLVENRSEEEIPNTILFERRREKVGYRMGGAVQKETILEPPELSATIEDLGRDLEGMLVAQGLYQDEAHAMVETWRDSWFEEGSRLLYIVPAQMMHAVLPLSISPAPTQTVRVFVGRLEIVTLATEKAVERAFATQDKATLAKYSRFLEPILQAIIQKERNPARAKKLYENLNSFYNSEIAQNQRRN